MKCANQACTNEADASDEDQLCPSCSLNKFIRQAQITQASVSTKSARDANEAADSHGASSVHWRDPTMTANTALTAVRNALQKLATAQDFDPLATRKEIFVLVSQLDNIIRSLQHEQYQFSFQLQQSICNADIERERRKIDPIKTTNPSAPHRIDWKRNIGF